MRTEDAISSLKCIKNSFTGDCTTNTLVPISRVDVEALSMAIKSLENQIDIFEELEKIRDDVSWIAETTIDRNTGIAYCRKNVIYRIIEHHISELKGETE